MEIEELIKDLTPNVLSMEMIEKEKLVPEFLYELKIDGKIIGPFSLNFLKTYFAGKDTAYLMVKNMESIIWIPMQQHSAFFTGEVKKTPSDWERREFYLLINGRKVGPYKTEDIEHKVRTGELLFTDLISEDEGAHWCKLYDMSHVDLRKHQGTELPSIPSKVMKTPTVVPDVQEQIGMVGDLVKVGIESEKEKGRRFADLEINNKTEEKSSFLGIRNILILVVVLLLGIYLYNKAEKIVTKELVSTPEESIRTPASVPPLKSLPQPMRTRPERKIERKEYVRPQRYPTAPAQEAPVSEQSVQDDYVSDVSDVTDVIDDYPEDEVSLPKKPNISRRRSRPKPIDETYEEPIEDFLDQ